MTSSARNGKATGDLFDRVPPSDLEAEKCVLGSAVLVADALDEVATIVRPADFYDSANGQIYSAMLSMRNDDEPIEWKLLVARLKKSGVLESVGGTAYIAELAQAVLSASNAKHYAKIVAEKSQLRAMISAAQDTIGEAFDPTKEPRELIAKAEQRIFSVAEQRATDSVVEAGEVVQVVLDELQNHPEKQAGIQTGFYDLDKATSGLQPGALIILAARPSMGKTALALNIAERIGIEQQQTVLFVSLEMRRDELVKRLLSSVAQIDLQTIKDGKFSQPDMKALAVAQRNISEGKLFIDDAYRRTMTEIAATARRLKRRNKLALVVVDYLQLIEPDNTRDPRQEQVALIARRLKGLARELNIPVLCLAQLNRQNEAASDKRPQLSHLRESGAIEQDADVVSFVHRQNYYEQSANEADAELLIRKNRNGKVGTVRLLWVGGQTRFDNAALPGQAQEWSG